MPKVKTNLAKVKDFRNAAQGSEKERDAKQDVLEQRIESIDKSGLQDWKYWNAITKICACYNSPGPSTDEIGLIFDWVRKYAKTSQLMESMAAVLMDLHDKVDGDVAALAERNRVDTWITNAKRIFAINDGQIVKLLSDLGDSLKSGTRARRQLFDKLPQALGEINLKGLREVGGTFPFWLGRSVLHCSHFLSDEFWTKNMIGMGQVKVIAEKLYDDKLNWNKSTTSTSLVDCTSLNKFVKGLSVHTELQCKNFMEMFTCTEWNKLHTEWRLISIDLKKKDLRRLTIEFCDELDGVTTRKKVGSSATTAVTNDDIGKWLVHYREIVLRLFNHGYPIEFVAEAYKQGLTFREMLTLTWFEGKKSKIFPDVFVKLGKLTSKGLEPQHGFIVARPKHLAERHLYSHFQFDATPEYPGDDPIKDHNTFYPRRTTPDHISTASDGLVVPDWREDYTFQGTVNNQICPLLIAYSTGTHGRVKTLYPDRGTVHDDYFSGTRLKLMKLVAAKFRVKYCNDLPQIDWMVSPRGELD